MVRPGRAGPRLGPQSRSTARQRGPQRVPDHGRHRPLPGWVVEMTLAARCAALMFLGVVAFAIFAGADFGSGVWDLLAGDAQKGGELRAQIDKSIGPVWEANHVWLIYVLVFMWT